MQFLWGLGLPEDEAEFYDVYGFDEELLKMVPKPVLAVLFLFPITAEVIISDPLMQKVQMAVAQNTHCSMRLDNRLFVFCVAVKRGKKKKVLKG